MYFDLTTTVVRANHSSSTILNDNHTFEVSEFLFSSADSHLAGEFRCFYGFPLGWGHSGPQALPTFTLGIDGFRTAVFSAWLRMVLGARKALSWIAFQAAGLKSESSEFSPLFTDSPA